MLKKKKQSFSQRKLGLPRLRNPETDLVESMARASGIPIDQCPTCLTKRVEVGPGIYGWENGTYRYRGHVHECDCQTQMDLRKHYLLANIPDQYQRLNWMDFQGDGSAIDAVDIFLTKWPTFKINGMGLEFSAFNLGVGKTFAATYVGKELVKLGERVYFIPFLEVISTLSKDNDDDRESRMRDTPVLILDEVIEAMSGAQHQLFSMKFEELIRHRTNFNRVTIMTTNLEPDELRSEYPRTYSLLEAKQIRVAMSGVDARQTFIAQENLELIANEEVRPIT